MSESSGRSAAQHGLLKPDGHMLQLQSFHGKPLLLIFLRHLA